MSFTTSKKRFVGGLRGNRVEKLKKKIRTKTFLCATISLSLLALVVAGAFLLYQSRKIILYTQIIVCSVHKM